MAPAFSPDQAGGTPTPAGKWGLPPFLTSCNPFKSNRNKTLRYSEKSNRSRKEQSPVSSDPEYESGDTAMSTAPAGPYLPAGPYVKAVPYQWPHDGPLDPATTALVIIDMQRDFCEETGYMSCQGYDITPTKRIIPVIESLLKRFRSANYPIYFTREGHRRDLSTLSSRELFRSQNNENRRGIGDQGRLGRLLVRGEYGHDIIDSLRPREDEPIIDKPGRGAFAHTDFELILRIKGIKNLVICGVTTDVCVTSTMREANDRRYDCVLVADACAAGTEAGHRAAVNTIKEEGGIFGSVTTVQNIFDALGPEQVGSSSKMPVRGRNCIASQPDTQAENQFPSTPGRRISADTTPGPNLPSIRDIIGRDIIDYADTTHTSGLPSTTPPPGFRNSGQGSTFPPGMTPPGFRTSGRSSTFPSDYDIVGHFGS